MAATDKNGTETVRNPDGTFAPGNSGGPGRPKKEHSLTQALTEVMDERPELRKSLIVAILAAALGHPGDPENGIPKTPPDLSAINQIWNRVDGMPVQRTRLGGDEEAEAPLIIEHVHARDADSLIQ